MKVFGYGYRKNCFGERLFYEDEMVIGSYETGEKVIKKALALAKKEWDFSFKVCSGDECWSVWCRADDKDNGVYTMVYSERWNSVGHETKMSGAAILKAMKVLMKDVFECVD